MTKQFFFAGDLMLARGVDQVLPNPLRNASLRAFFGRWCRLWLRRRLQLWLRLRFEKRLLDERAVQCRDHEGFLLLRQLSDGLFKVFRCLNVFLWYIYSSIISQIPRLDYAGSYVSHEDDLVFRCLVPCF
mmetsp:Transcript_3168/g.12208  ORF Transcript_3168/g.12208 Transcript_3168/m.12208 type:complete len:130 (-) Transcript_3168:846-1235(-)